MNIRKEYILLSFVMMGFSLSLGGCSVSKSSEKYADNDHYERTIEMISPEGNTIPDRALF